MEYICCFCGKRIIGFGNDPWPVNTVDDTYCCDDCNMKIVIPTRIKVMKEYEEKNK